MNAITTIVGYVGLGAVIVGAIFMFIIGWAGIVGNFLTYSHCVQRATLLSLFLLVTGLTCAVLSSRVQFSSRNNTSSRGR